MKECREEKGYPIETACKLLHVARSAYHRWAAVKLSHRTEENERLADKIEKIHEESPDKGYRRLNDDLRHDYGIHVNDKRVLRICRAKDIRSTVKYCSHGCTRQAKNPLYIAENILDRQFYASKPNEKWLTDVTEFRACLKYFDKREGKADNKGKQVGDEGECVNIQAISAGKSMKRYERI